MFSNYPLIWHLLAIDYRNKVATMLEEVESLKGKVAFFLTEFFDNSGRQVPDKFEKSTGKEVFLYLFKAIEQLKERLLRYDISDNQFIWPEDALTANALANYRRTMEDLNDALRQLTIIEDRFIQQMEARPLYFPSPRIFRRRHEEYQMQLNDFLVNKQVKLVKSALSALFPKAKQQIQSLNYHVLSSTEFILDSRIVREASFLNPFQSGGGKHGAGGVPVFYAKHPYWFQVLPIMLPETAHEHSHICLMADGRTASGPSGFVENAFPDLITDLSTIFQLAAPELGRRAWPKKFTAVMIEELVADIVAVMIFGEAYLLPLFLQLAAVNEAISICQAKIPPLTALLPWWVRLLVIIEILFQPRIGKIPLDTFAGATKAVIEDHCNSFNLLLPPDKKIPALKLQQFYRTIADIIIGWLRPLVEHAFERLETPLPLNAIRWQLNPLKEEENSRKLFVVESIPGHRFSALGKIKDPLSSKHGWYSLWTYGYPGKNSLPSLGEFLQDAINHTLPRPEDKGKNRLKVELPNADNPPWSLPIDQSVPIEYITWAGYMCSVAGLEDRSKTVMGSFQGMIGRGMLTGFETIFQNKIKHLEMSSKGHFKILPQEYAAHRARQLYFIKWRWESFLTQRSKLTDDLEQTTPWQWDQNEGFRFWTLGPFSALLSSGPGFSRRSRYPDRGTDKGKGFGSSGYPIPLEEMGHFGEETVIFPWMVFEDNEDIYRNTLNRRWHATIQIRVKTARHFMRQRRDKVKNSSGRYSDELIFDPVSQLLTSLGRHNVWRHGDTVFSSLGWSHLVIMLPRRTLDEIFFFKNVLQGIDEVDRTQTTLGTLFSKGEDPGIKKSQFCFRSTIRLGDVPDEESYENLQSELIVPGITRNLEIMPGIFDLQIEWECEPTFDKIMMLMEKGMEVANQRSSSNHNKPRNMISDIQTLVSQAKEY